MGAPRGWGRIEQTPSGWRAEIRIAGTRVRSSVCATRRDAQRWLDELRRQKLEDESGATARGRARTSDATYRQAADRLVTWWRAGRDRVRTERTRTEAERDLERVLASGWRDRRIAATTERDIDDYAAALRARGLSTSTIRQRLYRLAQCHAQAVRERWITAPPCRIVAPRLVIASRRTCASDDDVERYLAATASDPVLTVAVLLAADAGLRVSEIVRLRRDDVREGWLHVAVRTETDRTKSGRGRDVPILTARLAEALVRRPGGRVVPRTVDALRAQLGRALGSAPQMHALRHRWVTRLLEAGEPAEHVRRWTGHRDLRTTVQYSHAAAEPTAAARGALGWPTASPRTSAPPGAP